MATKINSPTAASSSSSSTSCPWGKVASSPPVRSFADVMDEEFAQQLQKEDMNETNEPITQAVEEIVKTSGGDSSETDNDLLLAQMLQLEFDRENDNYVKSMEKNYNGTSKVSMSFKNFRTLHPYEAEQYAFNSDGEDTSDDDDEMEEFRNRQYAVGKAHKPGEEMVTKHDSLLSERKNAKNVENFPFNFASGDVGKKDIRLPNHVYNKLKAHSVKEERNEMRLHEKKEHSTHEKALDENTRLVLYKMVNNGTLETVSGIVSTGKEAVVMHAKGGEMEGTQLPAECALKIFKTTLSEFKTREKYIKDDHRFRDRFTKQNPRKIIKLWAEKEFRNLTRMKEAGISCPRVVCLKKHVLVMSFIGKDRVPAQKLKEARLNKEQLKDAYEQCTNSMKLLYEKCNLIHSDLSEYNILWFENQCFFIDVSQSVEPVHPHAYHFLLRDCRNITQFFSKCGVATVMKEDELFTHVCGKKLDLTTSLDEIEKECSSQFEKDVELLTFGIDSKKYEFDYHFKQMQENEEEEEEKESETGAIENNTNETNTNGVTESSRENDNE